MVLPMHPHPPILRTAPSLPTWAPAHPLHLHTQPSACPPVLPPLLPHHLLVRLSRQPVSYSLSLTCVPSRPSIYPTFHGFLPCAQPCLGELLGVQCMSLPRAGAVSLLHALPVESSQPIFLLPISKGDGGSLHCSSSHGLHFSFLRL